MEDLLTEFNGKLAQSLQWGQYFDIEVKAIATAKSFNISLATEKLNVNPLADIGIHVVVNFADGQITANTRFSGQWSKSNVSKFTDPINLTEYIRINILLEKSRYQISVNGNHQMEILYKTEIDLLEAIQVGGDIKRITRVDHRQVYPELWPLQCVKSDTSSNKYMYISSDIPIKFVPGHVIVISGHYFDSERREGFHIDMRHAHKDVPIITLNVQYGVREMYISGKNQYVLNSDTVAFPFDVTKPFRIGIACTEDKFLIAVDGSYFGSCNYLESETLRLNGEPLGNIVGIKIFGDKETGLKITEVDYILLDTPDCNDFVKLTKMK